MFPQMLRGAKETEAKFAPLPCKLDDSTVGKVTDALALSFATITEGLLVTALLSAKLSDAEKSRKVDTCFKRLREQAKLLAKPVEPFIHPVIVAEGSRLVLK